MNKEFLDKKLEEAKKRRELTYARLKRRIEMGYIKGKILPNGAAYQTAPKGIQNWYDTRTLVHRVTEIFDRNEKTVGRRICHINGKWQLQIRGKHLRRLLKAMPNVKQTGRMLVEEN
jgi:hypothetical protein